MSMSCGKHIETRNESLRFFTTLDGHGSPVSVLDIHVLDIQSRKVINYAKRQTLTYILACYVPV